MNELLAYVPFRDPLWGGWDYWALFLLPLSVLIAIAYKGVRLEKIEELPGAAAWWTLKLLGSLVGLGLALWAVEWIAAR